MQTDCENQRAVIMTMNGCKVEEKFVNAVGIESFFTTGFQRVHNCLKHSFRSAVGLAELVRGLVFHHNQYQTENGKQTVRRNRSTIENSV